MSKADQTKKDVKVATPTKPGGGGGQAKSDKPKLSKEKQALSKNELDRVTEVFKMYETGLREAAIYPKVTVEERRRRRG